MEVPKKDDILLLADEKFDFDLSLSSSSANEDDEVFFGPVGHKERCVAASLELNHHVPEERLLPGSEGHFTWSPLTGEKFVEVYTEAHLLAFQIESKSKNKAAQAARPEDLWSQSVERFIQESKLKINLFEKEMEMRKSPRSLKRETYYLSDSPLRAPLSQTPLGAASAQAGQAQTQGPLHSPRSSLPVEPGAAPPPHQAGPQKKVTSQLVRPRASSERGKTIHAAVEQLGPKRTLLKPSGCAGGLSRKSSSSGSVSGGISSVCASPATCRAKSSEPARFPANSSPPVSCTGQSGRVGPAVSRQSLQGGPGGASCRRSKWTSAAEVTREPAKALTPAAVAQAPTLEQGGPGLSSHSSWSPLSPLNTAGSARGRDSRLPCRTKAMPTPTRHFKVPKFSTGEPADGAMPKSCRAQRPYSCTSVGRVVVHSTPAGHSSGPASPGHLSGTTTPVSTRRGSALPTPASRRLSSLPRVTPKTVPRALASPPCASAPRLSSELRKKCAARAAPTRASRSEAASRREDSSSDGSCSPPSAVPQALTFSPEKSDLAVPKGITAEEVPAAARPPEDTRPREAILVDLRLEQLAITPKAEGPALVSPPLVDLCSTPEASVAPGSEGRPLIDLLINTPDMNRTTASKPLHDVGQLIDLTSPLIQLSPEADKENVDSPLLKF
ncbi:G2 and S phase-expressed protein 1 isoform X2 [Leopardus geoffroyi]|uniref:G2 and S phase-expressed protein 1 isoform X2 n=1 Tax=Leopardus geoffroyi TaxID=46844 RepID=UPI001E261786|nr:G2 and S phase-expressed protein 1 isoform X2 [Leopardus geoffroyi]